MHTRIGIQYDIVEGFHDVAEHSAERAARRACLSGKLFLEIGFPLGTDDNCFGLFIIVDTGDYIVCAQHVLVQQIAGGEIFGIVADRHQRHDLATVEKQRQRPLNGDGGLDRFAVLVRASNPFGQTRILRIGRDEEIVVSGRGVGNVIGHAGSMYRFTAAHNAQSTPLHRFSPQQY
jgi:hypothetical protein